MGVLDRLPEGELTSLIHRVEAVSSEIKARQTIGSTGVIVSAVQSGGTSDITIPANDSRDVLLQFTPSDVAFGGGLAFRAYVSINSGAYNEVDPGYRLRVGSDNVQAWRLFGNNGSNGTPMTYKFIIVCIGSGTFTCSLVT